MTDVVLLEVSDRIATVTLNRPESRNALSTEVLRTLPRLVAEADGRDDVDVIILTGADPAFCAGLDLKELGSGAGSLNAGSDRDSSAADKPRRHGPLHATAKPIIGAVNGSAITGGFELALNCDFLVASDRARFADTHARVGIQPGWGLTHLLPQAIGFRRAREMSATGNFIDAPTALAWGLVNHVVPHEELIPFTRGLALDIVSNDQSAVRKIYDTYDKGADTVAGPGWAIEMEAAADWMQGGISAEQIEARRQAVVDRGRTQV